MRRWRGIRLRAALGALALALAAGGFASAPGHADEPDFIVLGAGVFDINDDQTAAELRLEYRSDLKLLFLTPLLGVMINSDAGAYIYGGFGLDLFFGRRLVFTPNAAVGAYENGSGKDLGHVIEFRTGAELAYRFDDYSRLGLAFNHISNASIDDNNPGTESLVVTYAMPLD